MINKVFNKEVILYLLFGVLTTLVNIFSFYLLVHIFLINVYVSNIIAWIISVLFAFFTNKSLVFESKSKGKKALKEMYSFFFFRIISLLFDMGSMYIFISILNLNDLISKILANILVVVLNYIFSKCLIFKEHK